MVRRFVAFVLASSLALVAIAAAPAAAATSAPIPSSMAAVGDSITQAASTGGSLGADAPQNSWSTGTSSTVNSHLLRLRAAHNPSLVAHNLSVSGAKVADLNGQMLNVVALDPDPGYLTVLIGGNDLCTDTVAQMTSVADFRARFATAMQTITTQSPGTYVYVVSIPDVYQLWNLFKNNFWARLVWASASICQSLLANPTSTQTADVQRRADVRQRNIDYNIQLAEVCAQYASRCHFDNNAVFDTKFTSSDVSGDYFHPSVAGQAKLARVSWDAGYQWASTPPSNQPPVAAFTFTCSGLTCSFTDTSTDTDGTITSRAWTFGDGATSTATHPTHTYAGGGTFTVGLTVTDDKGSTGTASQAVTVQAPTTASIHVAALSGQGTSVNRNFWRADVTATVKDTSGNLISGATVTGSFSPGGSKSCTTGPAGTCVLASDNLRTNIASVTFTVGGVTHATLQYDSSSNVVNTVTVGRPL
jgi:PKD repeat protein